MSTQRFLVLLVAALVAIGGAFWLASQRHLARATLAGDPIVAELKPALNEVTTVHLAKGDGSGVTLVRQVDGWTVQERGYPADVGRVRKLLLDLAGLQVVEEKTHDPKNYPQLGVDDPTGPGAQGVLVELTGARTLPGLIVGKASGSRAVFVRRRGAEASFLARPQVTLDTAPKSWLDRTLLDIKSERVRDVSVTLPTGPAYTAARTHRADADFTVAPLPKGRSLSSPAAPDAAGTTLAGLNIDDVRTVTDVAAPEHVVLRTFDGLVVQVDGLQAGEHRFIRLSARVDAAARADTPAPAPAPAPAAAPAPAPAAAPGRAPAAPPMPTVAEVEAEAAAINARTHGFEFEIPGYKFDAIFRPLEDLLARDASKDAAKHGAQNGAKHAGASAAKGAGAPGPFGLPKRPKGPP